MQHIQEKKSLFYIIILSILVCLVSPTAFATKKKSIETKEPIASKSNRLLNILKWNELYDQERKRDISYLLGNVDGAQFKELSTEQKKQVAVLMQKIALKQMTKDRKYFRKFLQDQYNKFFTADELNTLISYFNTNLMQMVISSKLENSTITAEDIRKKITQEKDTEKTVISKMSNSYLNTRYNRFLERVNPLVAKMIVDRLKEVLTLTVSKIPELIQHVKGNKLDDPTI